MATVKITQTDEGLLVERVGENDGNNDHENDKDDDNEQNVG